MTHLGRVCTSTWLQFCIPYMITKLDPNLWSARYTMYIKITWAGALTTYGLHWYNSKYPRRLYHSRGVCAKARISGPGQCALYTCPQGWQGFLDIAPGVRWELCRQLPLLLDEGYCARHYYAPLSPLVLGLRLFSFHMRSHCTILGLSDLLSL